LRYVSSIVLGINDALVELTGAMAGLTFALSNSRVVALTGIITGVAGGLSMAASEYLSKRHEKDALSPVKSSIYTGIAYLLTLALLVFPYLLPISPYSSSRLDDRQRPSRDFSFHVLYFGGIGAPFLESFFGNGRVKHFSRRRFIRHRGARPTLLGVKLG
jgi:drug/metabolite transporter (DMT)-like permease